MDGRIDPQIGEHLVEVGPHLPRKAGFLDREPAGFRERTALVQVDSDPAEGDLRLDPAGRDAHHGDGRQLIDMVEGCVEDREVAFLPQTETWCEDIRPPELAVWQ